MATSSKKTFKLNLLGLFNLETESDKTLSFIQILILLIIVLIFLLGVIWQLKVYAIPLLTGVGSIKKVGGFISNIIKTRSP